jgi:hypothetical protein
MWDWSIPHFFAIAATALTAFATFRQARHAIKKAELEKLKTMTRYDPEALENMTKEDFSILKVITGTDFESSSL